MFISNPTIHVKTSFDSVHLWFLFTKDLRFSKTSKNISSLTGKLVGDPTKTTRSLLETPHKKLTVLKHGASPEFRGNAQGYI